MRGTGVGVAPFVVIGGVELTLGTGIVIAGVLGMVAVQEALKNHQADLHENLQRVSDGFTSWLSSLSGWTRADIKEAHMLFEIDNVLYIGTPIRPNGEKPEELRVYHEARVTQDGKNVEIKKEAMTEREAIGLLKQMKRNEKRGIFSPNKNAADSLFKKITGRDPTEADINDPHGTGSGYFYHYHPERHDYHVWWPKS